MKWEKLNRQFLEKSDLEKHNYYENIVQDLLTSNTGKWYSKLKRMSGQESNKQSDVMIEELMTLCQPSAKFDPN